MRCFMRLGLAGVNAIFGRERARRRKGMYLRQFMAALRAIILDVMVGQKNSGIQEKVIEKGGNTYD